jgi:hypothetical protein
MSSYLGTFVLDFMSTDFKTDTDTATALLSQLKEECGFDNQFIVIINHILEIFLIIFRKYLG